jgi:DNA-directed RNA polymerase subunit omega
VARVTVEDCLELLVDQFALVHLASARYRQLHRGAERLVANKNKDVVCALREIAAGKVRFREEISEVSGNGKVLGNDSPALSDDVFGDAPLV